MSERWQIFVSSIYSFEAHQKGECSRIRQTHHSATLHGIWECSDLAEPLLAEGSRSTFSQKGMRLWIIALLCPPGVEGSFLVP